MRFGIGIPTCREGRGMPAPFAGPEHIVELARMAEDLGYDSVWADDHIMVTDQMRLPDKDPPNWYEPLVMLAACAMATKRIQLCAGVICLPFRNPIILAKQAATLDVLSGGRFGMGWGLGRKDELYLFDPGMSKVHRGRLASEQMEAIYRLFTEDKVTYKGEYIQFEGVSLYPRPLQRPPGIYIAGEAPDTPKRVARWATGQLMSLLASSHPVTERLEALASALKEQGRAFSEIDKCVVIAQNVARTHEEAVANFRKSRIGSRVGDDRIDRVVADNCIGTPDEVAGKIAKLAECGIDHYTIQHYAVQSFQELREQVQLFAEEVMPLVNC